MRLLVNSVRVEGDGFACFALEVEEEYGGGHDCGLCRP